MLMRLKILVSAFLVVAALSACGERIQTTATNERTDKTIDSAETELYRDIKTIEPFFKPMGIPGKDDWLWINKEPGQTFDDYIASNPVTPTVERNTIYVQPIGSFSSKQSQIIQTTSEYLEAFFGLPVKQLRAKPSPPTLSEADQRMIDYPPHRQIRTGYILDKILTPELPKDAAALIAFTNEDLHPGGTMYFVFGQASLENRVGVWSLFRLNHGGNFEKFLERTMKIAAHETGHMFSMRHCTKYQCVMSGSNHLGETDKWPIDACPECMAKISWMTKQSPKERYDRLARFAKKYKLAAPEKDFNRKVHVLTDEE